MSVFWWSQCSKMTYEAGEVVGIIPAAGSGRRLAPYPNPKELFPIGYQIVTVDGDRVKRPKVVSQYLLENMAAAGIRKFHFVIGRDKHDIMSYYGNGESLGVRISYLYQAQLTGMPHALDLALPWLANDATVVLGMPDTIIQPASAFAQLIDAHRTWAADLTLGLFHTDRPSKFGMVNIGRDFAVVDHVDKPRAIDFEWMWGIACWGPRFTALLHDVVEERLGSSNATGRETVLGDVFDAAIASGFCVKGLPIEDGQYIDIGTYDDLKQAILKYT